MEEITILPAELLAALQMRTRILQSNAQTLNGKIDELLAFCGEEEYAHELAEARRLYALGQTYFEQGYRFRQTARQIRGLGFSVPDGALAWQTWPAGYIATTEAERLEYAIKKV